MPTLAAQHQQAVESAPDLSDEAAALLARLFGTGELK